MSFLEPSPGTNPGHMGDELSGETKGGLFSQKNVEPADKVPQCGGAGGSVALSPSLCKYSRTWVEWALRLLAGMPLAETLAVGGVPQGLPEENFVGSRPW